MRGDWDMGVGGGQCENFFRTVCYFVMSSSSVMSKRSRSWSG